MTVCVLVCNKRPTLPPPPSHVTELLLGISRVIAWWRFISSETFSLPLLAIKAQREEKYLLIPDPLDWIQGC